VRPFELAEINQSPEIENNHELKYADDAFPQVEDTDIKRSAKNLDTALCRVSEASTREIENLVDEFHHLDKKLQADLPKGKTMAKRNGKRRAWTSESIRRLKALARKKTPAAKIARALKRTEGATRQKAFSLGVSLESRV
jgi:hypothetical protein